MRGLRAAGLGLALPLACATAARASEPLAVAVFPPQDRVGDAPAAAAFEQALRFELRRFGRLADSETTRDALRSLRLRNGDDAAPDRLRQLGAGLGVQWLVSSTLHEADVALPFATASTRVYSAANGELVWAGFRSGSGLDRTAILGLGRVSALGPLVRGLTHDLIEDLALARPRLAAASGEAGGRPALALVPFSGLAQQRATLNAELVTEAIRARLLAAGIASLSPNLCQQILRSVQGGRWGGVTADTRTSLRELGGARAILTGTVEAYDEGQSPRVAVGVRLIDTASGRIVWTGWRERDEARRRHWLGLGREHSAGAVAEDVAAELVAQIERKQRAAVDDGGQR